jgi:hypothetical protein
MAAVAVAVADEHLQALSFMHLTGIPRTPTEPSHPLRAPAEGSVPPGKQT